MDKLLVDRDLLELIGQLLDILPESKTIRTVRELLAQPAEAEGWKLVPVTPTPEMLDAAVDDDQGAKGLRMSLALSNYRAMIAAAPRPA